MVLVVCCYFSFLANAALTGISPYTLEYARLFSIPPATASRLMTYPSLAFGFCKNPTRCGMTARERGY